MNVNNREIVLLYKNMSFKVDVIVVLIFWRFYLLDGGGESIRLIFVINVIMNISMNMVFNVRVFFYVMEEEGWCWFGMLLFCNCLYYLLSFLWIFLYWRCCWVFLGSLLLFWIGGLIINMFFLIMFKRLWM